jgi:hypothetical protein
MSLNPTEVVSSILTNPRSLDHVRPLVSDDFTYVSLNYEDKDLKKVMPWCGTSRGVESLRQDVCGRRQVLASRRFQNRSNIRRGRKCRSLWAFYLHVDGAGKTGHLCVCRLRQGVERTLHLHAIYGGHLCYRRLVQKRRRLALPK